MLNFLLSNCTWRDGDVEAKFRQPFDLLAETNAAAKDSVTDNKGDFAETEIWLGWEDSNSQMSLPKLAFEVWPEFPFISERLAIRDFSRLSCQRVTCTPVQSIRSILQ